MTCIQRFTSCFQSLCSSSGAHEGTIIRAQRNREIREKETSGCLHNR